MVQCCNITKHKVICLVNPIISNILKETDEIDIEKLITKLTKRTQNINIRGNKKRKTIIYAINFYFKTFVVFLKESETFGIYNESDKKYVYSKEKINKEWIIVNDEDY
jgi:hypothetical protein